MLKFSEYGNGKNTLVLMHYLGGSQREWIETVAVLDRKSRCVTVDLPGFGDSADIPGYTIQEMTGSLLELLAHIRPDCYLLVGHGMSGKVAMAATRLASEQHSEVSSPMGMILVSPSPPGPTPVGESKRKQWVEWLGGLSGMNTEEEREYAEKFIRESSSRVIPPEIMERAIDDITFPIWLYVSITGVVVYAMQSAIH